MASLRYDEDVYDNPFFSGIISTYTHVLEKIVSYKGILCVPKFSLASMYQLTKADAMDHVLLPTSIDDEETEETEKFITASGKSVQICQGKIYAMKGFEQSREVTILFTETFHTDAGGSYKVLCLDGYLTKEREKLVKDNVIKTSSPTNYQQCMDLLWSHSGGQKSRDTLDKLLKTFSLVYERLEGENLRSIVDAASTHFAKAMQLLLKDSVVRKSARHNSNYMDSLKLAVETYMMNAIHKRVFRVITAAMASQDAEINKITRNLVDLQLSDLGIRKVFSQNIPPAKKELSMLNRYSTPMGRLLCIKRIVTVLTKPPKRLPKEEDNEDTTMMTSDDLLPILIFLIIKSEIPNWYANLVYMRHFHFAKSSDDDEFGFYMATIEAALEHTRTGKIQEEIQPITKKRERWNSFTLSDQSDLSPPVTRQSSSNQPSVIEEFFRNVQEGDEKAVQAMLEKPHKTSEEIHLMLCHPLCSCDRCDRMLSVFRTKSDLVTAYTRDNRGYTALHMAAYYGQGLLIDLLVKNNAVVDATDYLGLTPLHLACQRGYQNVMLLLLHFSADIMAMDNEGNTPLHLSCANGHEDCVKALVFYDGNVRKLQTNAMNEMKDTPLHLAAKWGFEGIVRTLLENGASATMCNRKGQTPVSLAQNVLVQRLLQMAAEGHYPDPSIQITYTTFTEATSKVHMATISSPPLASPASTVSTSSRRNSSQVDSFSQSSEDSNSFKIETAALEVGTESDRRKKKERLFKAVIGGDIQLVKFYLGVSETVSDEDYGEDLDDVDSRFSPVKISTDICHPLCQCHKCVTLHKTNKVLGEKVGVNVRTSTGSSPLHTAVLHNHSDIVELLLSLKADTSAQNHKSLTPLHLACCMRNSLVTDMLVRAKAKLDVEDMSGDTPLHIASSNGFINGVHTLIKAGANLNVVNKMGNSPLHEATKRNLMDTMGFLVRSGVDVTIKNKDGKLATDIAETAEARAILQKSEPKSEPKEEEEVSSPDLSKKESQNIHQLSIKELFAAFEESDLHTLQILTASIRSFDKHGSLKRTSTKDHSGPFLTNMRQAHSISNFNKGTLRKVKLLDKTDPLYIYSLSSVDLEDDLLTPMGDKLLKSFDPFSAASQETLVTSQSLSSDPCDSDKYVSERNECSKELKCGDNGTGFDTVYVVNDTDVVSQTSNVVDVSYEAGKGDTVNEASVTELTKEAGMAGLTDVADKTNSNSKADVTDETWKANTTDIANVNNVTAVAVTNDVVVGVTGINNVNCVSETPDVNNGPAAITANSNDGAGESEMSNGVTDKINGDCVSETPDVNNMESGANTNQVADVNCVNGVTNTTGTTDMNSLNDVAVTSGVDGTAETIEVTSKPDVAKVAYDAGATDLSSSSSKDVSLLSDCSSVVSS